MNQYAPVRSEPLSTPNLPARLDPTDSPNDDEKYPWNLNLSHHLPMDSGDSGQSSDEGFFEAG